MSDSDDHDTTGMWRDIRHRQQRGRDGRALAAIHQEAAARAWAVAHDVAVRRLEWGWQYRRADRILGWWPRTGRIALSGRDTPPTVGRAVGRHDRGDILGRLAVAFAGRESPV